MIDQDPNAHAHLSILNSKTYTYIQHPVPVRGPMDKRDDEIKIPTFLTKKERKRLRKQARYTSLPPSRQLSGSHAHMFWWGVVACVGRSVSRRSGIRSHWASSRPRPPR